MKERHSDEVAVTNKDVTPELVTVKVEPNAGMLMAEENNSVPENFEFVKVKTEPETEDSKTSSVASHIEKVFQSLMSKVRSKLEGKNIENNTGANAVSDSKVKTVPTVEEVQKQLSVRVPRVYGNSGLKLFKCDDCSTRFYNEASLAQHAKVHTVQKPYACKVCSLRFALRGNLVHHEATHKNNFPVFGCPFCGKDMKRKMFLNFHIKMHLSKQHGHHPCEICVCVFNTQANLHRHMRAHKPYRCECCGIRFFNQPDLDKHLEIHKEGLYRCEKCNQTFCNVRQLITHRVHHGNVEQFTCEICGRRISNRGSFVVHLKIHKKERRLSDKKFQTRRSYKKKP